MALTKVSGGILDPGINVAGIVTATGFDGPFTGGSSKNITAGIITATGFDLNGNGDISGNLVIGGNLTANGDFTTLNTTLREVEILRVDANTTAVAGIITQRGSGDILSVYDTSTEVFKIADGGDVGIARSIFHLGDTDTSIGFSAADTIDLITGGSSKLSIGSSITSTTAITIYNEQPELTFRDSNHSPYYYSFRGVGGALVLSDSVNGNRISFNASGSTSVSGGVVVVPSAQVSANLGVTGSIIISDQIYHAGDTDTKIRFPAADTFTVETAGTERFRIHADGEVAIAAAANGQTVLSCLGAYASSSTVDIQTWARSDSAVKAAMKYSHGTNSMNFGTTTNHPLIFQVNDTERIRIDSDGNILLKDAAGQGNSLVHYIRANDSSGNSQYQLGMVSSGNEDLYLIQSRNANLRFQTSGSSRWLIDGDPGHLLPAVAGAVNIGSASAEIGNVYIANTKYAYFGDGQELSISNSTNSAYIQHSGSGYLFIHGNDIALRSTAQKNYIVCDSGDSVDLYFDAANHTTPKLKTSATGIDVTGEVAASQDYPNFRPTLDLNFAAEKKLDPRLEYRRTGPASFVNEFGKVVLVGDNTPRFDHDPVTRESKGLLIEEERTNINAINTFRRSSDNRFGMNSADEQNAGENTNGVVSPVGTAKGVVRAFFTGSESAPNGSVYAMASTSSSDGATFSNKNTHTSSVWIRTGLETVFKISAHSQYASASASGSAATIDFIFTLTGDGTVTSIESGGIAASVTKYPNNWYRCTLTYHRNSTTTVTSPYGVLVYPQNYNSYNTNSQTGDIFWLWGPQVEDGAFPTSYIPTEGSTVTRGLDLTTVEGTDFSDIFDTDFKQFSIVADYDNTTTFDGNSFGIIDLWGESTGYDDRVEWFKDNSSPYHIETRAFGQGNALFSNGNLSASSKAKSQRFATSWYVPDYSNTSSRRFAVSMGGEAVDVISDNSGTTVPQLTRMGIGCNPTRFDLSGGVLHFKRLMVYNKTLSDNQLRTLSS